MTFGTGAVKVKNFADNRENRNENNSENMGKIAF